MQFQPQSGNQSVKELKQEIERLSLICEALWEILKEKQDLEDIDLIEHMTRLDLMDGKYDGRKDTPRPPEPCRRCGRILAGHHMTCLYCGETRMHKPF